MTSGREEGSRAGGNIMGREDTLCWRSQSSIITIHLKYTQSLQSIDLPSIISLQIQFPQNQVYTSLIMEDGGRTQLLQLHCYAEDLYNDPKRPFCVGLLQQMFIGHLI
uniref:Uncharacterized protein n=1 Tax=Cacopsylla melanoneura TaxID=428564 RepID=A0A8D9BF84_9HEMI